MFKAFLAGIKWGFLGYVRGGCGLSYHDGEGNPDYDRSEAFNRGANWGERLRYGRSFGGAKW